MRHSLLLLLTAALLSGCGTFTDSIARRASEMAADSAFKAAKDIELNRRLHLTLVGGPHLNQGRGSQPRPVMACVYVALSSDWKPPLQTAVGECGSREKDPGLVASSRQVVAPHQIVQLEIPLVGVKEAWLVIDADFAQRPSSYLPLRLPLEGRGWVHQSAWLDGTSLYDGKHPLPQVTAVKEPTPEPALSEPVVNREEPMPTPSPRSTSKKTRRALPAKPVSLP